MRGERARPIVIAAGGTGGHFFPAEALAAELIRRGHRVVLMTDARSGAERSSVFAGRETVVLPGAGLAGRGLRRGLAATLALARGTMEARRRLASLEPAMVVGFGGYPSVPPVLAARLLGRAVPRPLVLLHEQNAALGRANRLLARWADRLALGLPGTVNLPRRPAAALTGNPVRPAIAALAGQGYAKPEPDGPIRLLVTGGSGGARIFGTALPAAVRLLGDGLRARLRIAQQCRAEDLDRVRDAYAALGVEAELSPFFDDMPRRLAEAHFVLARAGASTVAELAVAGRPALLVPFPFATDRHQTYNAIALDIPMLEQEEFERNPEVLAEALARRLALPDVLDVGAHAMADHGIADAASRLADLIETTLADAAPALAAQEI